MLIKIPVVVALNLRGSRLRARLPVAFLVAGTCLFIGTVTAWSQDRVVAKQVDVASVDETRPTRGDDWRVTLGAGLSFVPKYEGSNEIEPKPLPLFDVTWRDRVFLNFRQGLGGYVIRTDRFRLGASVGYAFGRDQDDADQLRGLGDIDPAARGHLFGSYSLGILRLHADISRDFGGSDGFQVRPGATLMYPLSKSIKLSVGVSATWADDDYMEAFFGITPAQSARSGLPVFEAESGFKRADLKIDANWNLTESWFARASLGIGTLLGDAADSPIVESEEQLSFGVFVGYRF